MKEDLLQYIWQMQLFNKNDLQTVEGLAVNVVRPGVLNNDSGPDFVNAQVQIGELMWFGSVEIHIRAGEWKNHKHDKDPAYDNVVLHVVWDSGGEANRNDGTKIPTLELKLRVQASFLNKYENLLSNKSKNLACTPYLESITTLEKYAVLEKAAIERLERKAKQVYTIWQHHTKVWQQTALKWISRGYGFKVNAEAFATIADNLQYTSIAKERASLEDTIALLVAVSGLDNLRYFSEQILSQAGHFRKKNSLVTMQPHQFKKSRLRPANFPEVRLVQLAALLHLQPDLLTLLLHTKSLSDISHAFENTNQMLNGYKSNSNAQFKIGKSSILSIIINAVVPFRYAYGIHQQNEVLCSQALEILESLPTEENRYTKTFTKYGFKLKSALESQGVLEQYQFKCIQNKCLQCSIGTSIMKNHDLVLI